MNVQHAPRASTESRERHSSARVPGRWLLLARVGWLTLVVLTLAIFFASLPVYIAQLQTPCAGAGCPFSSQQFTPEQVGALKGMGLSINAYTVYAVALTLASVLMCLVVSALIVWRSSNDRMALLVALMLVTFGPIIATSSVAGSSSPWRVPNACLYFLTLALLVLVFLLFPSGQFVPRWTRWTLVVFLAGQVPSTFFPDAPFTLNTNASEIGFLMLVGEAGILAVVQVYRYRRVSSPLQRQQTKWVVFGMAIPISVFVSGTVLAYIFPALSEPGTPSGSLYQLAFAAIYTCLPLFFPLSFGFAMLRSRLWDIDVLINRALVYATLTGTLALVYVGSILLLQYLLRGLTQGYDVAIVGSTLVSAALFGPLRQRIQQTIDRRFYRRKYDAVRILAAFSTTLRNEVDLNQLREQLVAVIEETMQPTFVSLWLRPPAHDGKRQASWRATPPASSDGR
jgi:hypothetical protein